MRNFSRIFYFLSIKMMIDQIKKLIEKYINNKTNNIVIIQI
jgi:hypothetical protein